MQGRKAKVKAIFLSNTVVTKLSVHHIKARTRIRVSGAVKVMAGLRHG